MSHWVRVGETVHLVDLLNLRVTGEVQTATGIQTGDVRLAARHGTVVLTIVVHKTARLVGAIVIPGHIGTHGTLSVTPQAGIGDHQTGDEVVAHVVTEGRVDRPL